MRRIAGPTVLGMLMIAGLGCQTIGPLAANSPRGIGYAYRAGTASQSFARARDEVEPAVLEAMNDLAMSAIRPADAAPDRQQWEAIAADGRRVVVTVQDQGPLSVASVRVGRLGDQALSRALLDQAGIRLGTLPPGAVAVDPPREAEPVPHFSRDAVPDSVMLRDYTGSRFHDSPVP